MVETSLGLAVPEPWEWCLEMSGVGWELEAGLELMWVAFVHGVRHVVEISNFEARGRFKNTLTALVCGIKRTQANFLIMELVRTPRRYQFTGGQILATGFLADKKLDRIEVWGVDIRKARARLGIPRTLIDGWDWFETIAEELSYGLDGSDLGKLGAVRLRDWNHRLQQMLGNCGVVGVSQPSLDPTEWGLAENGNRFRHIPRSRVPAGQKRLPIIV